MIGWRKGIAFLALTLKAFTSFSSVQACEKDHMYVIETDSFGRVIVLWVESLQEKTLKISVNDEAPVVLSTSEQDVSTPKLKITRQGDIIVAWSAIGPQGTYELRARVLPYEGNLSPTNVLNEKSEAVLANSHKLAVNEEDDITVYWESLTFMPSLLNENVIIDRRELRSATCSRGGWSVPKTIALLRQGQE